MVRKRARAIAARVQDDYGSRISISTLCQRERFEEVLENEPT